MHVFFFRLFVAVGDVSSLFVYCWLCLFVRNDLIVDGCCGAGVQLCDVISYGCLAHHPLKISLTYCSNIIIIRCDVAFLFLYLLIQDLRHCLYATQPFGH